MTTNNRFPTHGKASVSASNPGRYSLFQQSHMSRLMRKVRVDRLEHKYGVQF